MGFRTFTAEFESPIAPARFFKASVLHLHENCTTIMPLFIKSAAIVEGDGGVGSIKEFHFTDFLPFKRASERVVELDKEKFVYTHSVLEGGKLGIKYKSLWRKITFEATPSGGSVCKLEGKIEELEGVEFNEEDENNSKEDGLATYKAVDAYLQANPDAYA
ncbi:hypothetical protein Sjap_007377 [Stephania japonica]|uniref:Bet v I/Major latex protein domain-containing protein n=1 Tax=Stephania japonica TaxID=461633 RepID=A0AAP0JMK5_9MAGN